jgi:hypothetical protein
MASKIKVDELETADGSGTIALQNQLSGLTSASMPTGSVLQVVESQMEGTGVTTTSSSFVATGNSVTITPSSTSSKILVSISGGGTYLPEGNTMAIATIYRDSTNIGHGTKGLESHYTVGTTGFTLSPHSMRVLDSPSTTSAITYQAYMKTDGGTFQYHSNDRGTISFIAMEIAG